MWLDGFFKSSSSPGESEVPGAGHLLANGEGRVDTGQTELQMSPMQKDAGQPLPSEARSCGSQERLAPSARRKSWVYFFNSGS